jgi:NAD(P)-dependent dehydrogenase (short-subunit alcohol dehydrogenase family)
MANKQIWFITGAGRGMGVDIAKVALAAGHAVVATGRNPERVSSTLGAYDDLLTVKLDVTSLDDSKDAARAAVDRFGGIDVLVNNAGNFYAGFFEEITPEDFRSQFETTMFGPMNVHPRGPSGHALPALGPCRGDLIDRWYCGPGVLHRLRRLQVRGGGLD